MYNLNCFYPAGVDVATRNLLTSDLLKAKNRSHSPKVRVDISSKTMICECRLCHTLAEFDALKEVS